MKKISIGKRLIGKGEPCFIIAEAGVNHNGDIEKAKQLINIAIDAGADAIKFQTFKPEEVVIKNSYAADYAQKNLGEKITQQELLKKVELSNSSFIKLQQYCDKKNIIFLSTPHTRHSIDFLEPLVPAYKFGSGDLTNFPALTHAAKKGKPMILGTGMATLREVEHAVLWIKNTGNQNIILLHCTTNYPCPLNEVNMKAMITMKHQLDCLVGYSDHTLGILTSLVAVSLGAVVIEKHFTLDRSLPGPDHKASVEPEELQQLVKEIREVELILGSNKKQPTPAEKKIMRTVRKSIVAKQDIAKGSIITKQMIDIKRPGNGLPPSEWFQILGKKAKMPIKKDELMQDHMVD